MEENTSKVLVAGDPHLAAAAVLNASGSAALLRTGQGTALFVINLCASMAPLANVAKTLPGFDAYRLYQVNRREDGRTRYRLRLGFFTSEADAETVLNSVRDSYPTAFTACLCDEDRKFARGFIPDSEMSAPAPRPVAPKIAAAPKVVPIVENKAAPKAEPPKRAAVSTGDSLATRSSSPVTPMTKSAQIAKAPPTDTVTVRALSEAKPTAKVESSSLDSTAKHKRIVEPPPAKASPVASKEVAKPAPVAVAFTAPATSPVSARDSLTTRDSSPVEIELSWDPPALQPPANAAPPTQVVAAAFKTQNVIKAPNPAPANSNATKAPAKAVVSAGESLATRPASPVAPKKVEAPKAAAKKETIAQPSKMFAEIELTLESEPAAPAKPAPVASTTSEPFRVGKGIEIPKTALSLESEAATAKPVTAVKSPAPTAPAVTPTAAKAAPARDSVATSASSPVKPLAEVSKMKAAQANAPAAIKAAVAPTSVRQVDGPPPDLDSTQTIRALTSDELKDDSQEKWFAIQLAVSDQPVNLDTMPRLDIFEAYRLYSVASAGSGKITHSLRAGFFREDHSAEAVAGYLKTFFNSPTVVRISIAEQSRFKDPPPPKPTPKTDAKVLDLSHARDRAPKVVPTVTMEVDTKKFDPMATGSFKANATGTHKALATGSHNALNATGTHKALSATGAHKALKAASKSATPPTKRSQPLTSATGKHKTLQQKKSLSQQLMDEARDVELSQSGIRKLPKNDSLLSKMFGRKK